MAEPILDLSTVVERPTILIDEKVYELLSPDELSVLDLQRMSADGRAVEAIMRKDDLSGDDGLRLKELLTGLTDRILVGVPEDVRERLTDQQRLRVAEVFTRLPQWRERQRRAAEGAPETASPTGERSSPGSSASTAADPTGGLPRRPSGSSVPIS